MVYHEKEVHVAYRRAPAEMDVCLGWVADAVAVELEEAHPDYLCLPEPSGRYLLTGQQCSPQTGHNDLDHTRQENSGFFIQLFGWRTRHYGCVVEVRGLSTTPERTRSRQVF